MEVMKYDPFSVTYKGEKISQSAGVALPMNKTRRGGFVLGVGAPRRVRLARARFHSGTRLEMRQLSG